VNHYEIRAIHNSMVRAGGGTATYQELIGNNAKALQVRLSSADHVKQ
jgi:hypothetical protein